MAEYETILTETRGRVALITLTRPEALNALNSAVMREVTEALAVFDADEKIGCIVLTGSEKAFAAGADIKEMQALDYPEIYLRDWFSGWERMIATRKPIVAAVAGYALGGGCELAMMCDIVIAADNAKFGQPEIKLGIIPGIGGTQRLTRLIGRSKAMEMCLTGRMMDATEAERAGLAARIVPAADLLTETMKMAEAIAGMSLPAVMLMKEAINRADAVSMDEGVRLERRLFQLAFATADRKEGMTAFVEKRRPKFENR